jgi:rRNA maturation RNase YbeY
VVISVQTARRQARAGDWTLQEELNRLLLHGVLHLLGHDHERGGPSAERMRAEEARLSSALVAGGVPCAREDLGA